MIHYLNGRVEFKSEKFVVIEVSGVGYKVFCSPQTLEKLSENKQAKLFTFLYLKEESLEFYGFLTQKELELFETLNDISGIGPKTAMMLASVGPLEKLKEMMETGQLPSEIKGIGKKKMQKILLELTGKIKELGSVQKFAEADEALDTLISLGFPKKKAKEVLDKIPEETPEEEKIKIAIKTLGGG